MNQNDKPEKLKISMTDFTRRVLAILRQRRTLSFSELSEIITAEMIDGTPQKDQMSTIKRRIYDVINVMDAVGYIHKGIGSISIAEIGLENLAIKELENNIALKKQALAEKKTMLNYYHRLIERNRHNVCLENRVHMHSILIGFTSSNGSATRSLDGKLLEITSETPPLFWSPMDMLKCVFANEQVSTPTKSDGHKAFL